ncbi:MAG: SRPBCC domain-containing protein [Verrucomicrobia bacterium]|nr:SRPBCC domain-containing protein [Verrucomicrobiota bacterium]
MSQPGSPVQSLEITREIEIAAPIHIVFESILEQIGPLNEAADGTSMPMKLELWPGGRWFRDCGGDTGHFWGVVQSIRPNDMLEIHGPLFISAATISHVIYRLAEEGPLTRIWFAHRAFGQIPPEYQDGFRITREWEKQFERIRLLSERRATIADRE